MVTDMSTDEFIVRAVRDASGNPLPLSHVRADANLYVPELAVRGQRLSAGPQPGVNQFYIIESSYRESASGDVRLAYEGPAAPTFARCDAEQMRQVLWNLVRNAIAA